MVPGAFFKSPVCVSLIPLFSASKIDYSVIVVAFNRLLYIGQVFVRGICQHKAPISITLPGDRIYHIFQKLLSVLYKGTAMLIFGIKGKTAFFCQASSLFKGKSAETSTSPLVISLILKSTFSPKWPQSPLFF